MSVSAVHDKISLGLDWQCSSPFSKESVQRASTVATLKLVFPHSSTEIFVDILTGFPLKFRCDQYAHLSVPLSDGAKGKLCLKTVNPRSLHVTPKQVRHLKIIALSTDNSPNDTGISLDVSTGQISEKNSIPLEMPDLLEVGEKYTLVITSNNGALLSAHIRKNEDRDQTPQIETRIEEVRKATDALKAFYEIARIKELGFERERWLAYRNGEIESMTSIMSLEQEQSRLVATLSDELGKRGISEYEPQSAAFRTAKEATEAAQEGALRAAEGD